MVMGCGYEALSLGFEPGETKTMPNPEILS